MLVIRALEDIPEQGITKGDMFHLYVVDSHHHMGHEKSHRNTPSGAYDFYALLFFEMERLAKDLMDNDQLLFEPIEVRPPKLPGTFFDSRDSWKRMNHGWLVDRTIVFPYSDDYSKSDTKGTPSFKVSNDKIAAWTTRAPHSTRLIGFARVDPSDAKNGPQDIATNELERAITKLGLRGLKLHPLAQLFLDDLEHDIIKHVLKKAGELGIPVIFDTRNIRTVERIHNLVNAMRQEKKYSTAMKQLRVILAHCGMSPGDPKLFDALRNPIISADTSSLHGRDIPLLFQMAKDRLSSDEISWSEPLLFGTDFSFLGVQAAQVILHLLSRNFKGTLTDTQRILGGNALSLIGRPFRIQHKKKKNPRQFSSPSQDGLTKSRMEEKILELIHVEKWDLQSLDYMIPPKHSWPSINSIDNGGYNGIHLNSYILTMKSPDGTRNAQLWLNDTAGDYITLGIMNSDSRYILESTELANQRMDQRLMKALVKNTTHETNVETLLSMIGNALDST